MKKRWMKTLCVAIALSLNCSIAYAYEDIVYLPNLSDYETRVMLDGKYLDGAEPILNGQDAILPLRAILENADYTIKWDEDKRIVLINSADDSKYELSADSGTLSKDSKEIYRSEEIAIKQGIIYVPEEIFAYLDGVDASWDPATNTVVVVTANPKDNLYVYDLGEGLLDNPVREDTKYRMQGIIGVPEGEKRPIAIIMHGSHPIQKAEENRYDLGFSYLVDALADAGYLAVSMNVGINYSFEDGEPVGNTRTVQVVQQQLEQLKKAINGEDTKFPVDLTGKGDLNQVVLIGHSRGGGDAFTVAESLQDLAQVKGIISVAPAKTTFVEEGVLDIPTGIILPQYDGDVTALDGANIFEDIRNNQTKTAEVIYLEDGNHGGFSTALLKADPFGRREDLDKIMPPFEQQEFLKNYTLDFMKSVSQNETTPFADDAKLPNELYGEQVVIRNYDHSTAIYNAEKQGVEGINAQNADIKNVSFSNTVSNTAGAFKLPGSFMEYGLVQIDWQESGASVEIPLAAVNAAGDSLRIDLTQDSSSDLTNKQDLSLTVTVKDKYGNKAEVIFDDAPASLRYQEGEMVEYDNYDGTTIKYYSTFNPLGSLIIDESELNNVKIKELDSVKLTFHNPSGSIMLREIALQY